MNTLRYLRDYAVAAIDKHPEHREAIVQLVELAAEEMDGGSSMSHEVELAIQDIDFLIKGEEE
jgi:hypothetical protein